MIGIIFSCGTEMCKVTFDEHTIYFSQMQGMVEYRAPITAIKFDRNRVWHEYPDLKDDPQWNVKAGERIINLFQGLSSNQAREKYLITELGKVGYRPLYKQVAGHRVQKYGVA